MRGNRTRITTKQTDWTAAALAHRRLVVLAAAVLGGVLALVVVLNQGRLYRAEAQVYLARQILESSLVGSPTASAFTDASTMASTQAQLATVPQVVRRTLTAAGEPADDKAVTKFLGRASTDLPPTAPGLVTFVVNDPHPARAIQLVNTWAQTAVRYRRALDVKSIQAALGDIDAQLRSFGKGDRSAPLYQSLVDKQVQLRTMAALEDANGTVVRTARKAPSAHRSRAVTVVLGVLVGGLLAAAALFALSLFGGPDDRDVDGAGYASVGRRKARHEELVR